MPRLLALALAALLTACGASSATPPTPPPAAPAAAPTAAPAAALAPSPTLSPQPSALSTPSQPGTPSPPPTLNPQSAARSPAPLLPAPLFVLAEGAIRRVEVDGAAVTTVVSPAAHGPVAQFDLSPDGRALAYVAGDAGAGALFRAGADGASAALLLPGPVAAPRFSPDGARLAVRYAPAVGPDAVALAGVYLLPATGGEPALLQSDDPPADQGSPGLIAGLSFEPLAWSPDGTRLLLTSFLPDADYCGMAVRDLASGGLTAIVPPEGALADCGRASWSADGSAVILTLQAAGASAARLPGLWRADPASGATAPLLPETLDGAPAIYAAPRQLADGLLYTFIARAPGFDPLAYPPQTHEFALFRAAPGDTTPPEPLRVDTHLLHEALWAPDGGGAVALVAAGGEDPDATRLLWLPASGDPPLQLPAGGALAMAWGARPALQPAQDTTILAGAAAFAYMNPDSNIVLATPAGARNLVWYRAPARRFAWAPNGAALAVEVAGGLHLWDAASGATQLIHDGELAGAFAWAPDGRGLAFAAAEGLRLWEASTTLTRTLVPGARPTAGLAWSVDGSRIAFAAPPPGADWCGDGAPCRMWLVETASGALSHIGEGERPHFAPRGDALAAHLSRDQPPTMREDALAVPLLWPAPDGPPLTLGAATPALWERAAWSADGRLLAAGHALATADGGTIEPLVDDEDTVANGISPDGGFVALAALTIVRSPEDDAGRKWTDLALLDRASGARRAIWRSDEEPGHGHYWRLSQVAWSPDGTLLTFTGCGTALATDGTASLKADARGCGVWVAAGDGSGLRLLPESAGAERPLEDALPPRFAPDGTALLFVRWEGPPDETARPSVWLWQAGAPAPTKVADGSMPAWRP